MTWIKIDTHPDKVMLDEATTAPQPSLNLVTPARPSGASSAVPNRPFYKARTSLPHRKSVGTAPRPKRDSTAKWFHEKGPPSSRVGSIRNLIDDEMNDE